MADCDRSHYDRKAAVHHCVGAVRTLHSINGAPVPYGLYSPHTDFIPPNQHNPKRAEAYSTVTLFARFLG